MAGLCSNGAVLDKIKSYSPNTHFIPIIGLNHPYTFYLTAVQRAVVAAELFINQLQIAGLSVMYALEVRRWHL